MPIHQTNHLTLAMDSLPAELQFKVAGFLCLTDLRSLRLVSKRYAAIAARPLFELLRFSGRRQDEPLLWNFGPTSEHELPQGCLGRTRTVEFGKIPEAVDEILGNSLAQYTKTLVFDPAYYRRGFWRDYLMHLENEMHEPVLEDASDSEVARILEERRTRPEREAPITDAAQIVWNQKAAQQQQNEGIVVAALAKLFRATNPLEKVYVKSWEFYRYAGLQCNSYMIDVQRRDSFPSTFFLEILAQALHSVGRSIKRLHVSEFFAEHIHDSPATRHLFTGLQDIRLDVLHVEFLLEEAQRSQSSSVLVELFKCALPTLKRLSIIGGGKWPNLAARGAHSLLKILGDGPNESPLSFPKLEFVRLGGLILSTPPLLRFLHAQPCLKRLEFSYIYLSTPDAGWAILAESLPASVEFWKVCGPLGHEPVNGDGPTAYNWMTTWVPRELPPTSGWKAIPRSYGTCFARIS
ncbi:hypothetical protein HD806DRAFT_56312 [Xylariaceae sp. AK1471]|nr:hypothetical protein HD806DRAFT_56312 [Xylariaceae sp. AK1471]